MWAAWGMLPPYAASEVRDLASLGGPTTMCDVPADCLGVSLDELHAMGVRLAMADWLPTPSMLIPSRNLALMDSRLDSAQRQEVLASLVQRGLDRLNPPG